MLFFTINSIKQLTTVLYCYILFISGGERLLQKSFEPTQCAGGGSGEREKSMQIVINNTSMVPVYEQLMDNIKQEIINGGIKEGEPLPSVRTLANELKISALTVKKAYDKLEEEGFIVTVHGKGSFVAATDMALAAEARKKSVEEAFALATERARALGLSDDEIREILEIILNE